MSSYRLLALVRPFVGVLPEVPAPDRKVPFQSRVLWSAIALGIFLVASQVRLFGILSSDSSDPFFYVRAVLASNRGSLMELGVGPLITSGMLLQFLAGANLIDVDFTSAEDRALFAGAQKLFALLIGSVQALLCVFLGLYGPPAELGAGKCVLLVLQLVIAGVVTILLDELLVRGYGLGSGISLFLTTNVGQSVVWKAFSPSTITTSHGPEFEGALLALVHLLFTWNSKTRALKEAFFRDELPNVIHLLATVAVFGAVICLQGFRVEIPIKSVRFRGQQGRYPVKLFYTSNISILLTSALTSNVFVLSQLLATYFPAHAFVRALGIWEPLDNSSQLHAVGGLSYYLSPPTSLTEAAQDPVHTLVIVTVTIAACALASKAWIDVSGSGPKDVAKQLKDNGMVMAGHRDGAMYKELKRVIPIAAAWGGATVGALSVAADLVGAFGTGTGILLAVTFTYTYFEMGLRESGGPEMSALGDLLG